MTPAPETGALKNQLAGFSFRVRLEWKFLAHKIAVAENIR